MSALTPKTDAFKKKWIEFRDGKAADLNIDELLESHRLLELERSCAQLTEGFKAELLAMTKDNPHWDVAYTPEQVIQSGKDALFKATLRVGPTGVEGPIGPPDGPAIAGPAGEVKP